MTDLVPKAVTAISFAEMDTADLKLELARALEITADNLVYMARLWRELTRRGEDLSELRTGLRTFLPLIADGRLDAQTAVQFAGNLSMLRALAKQPIDVQRRMAAGEKIAVLLDDGGKLIERRIAPDELSYAMIKQVFDGSNIRSIEEQKTATAPTAPKETKWLRVRMTLEEFDSISKKAAAANVTVSRFLIDRGME